MPELDGVPTWVGGDTEGKDLVVEIGKDQQEDGSKYLIEIKSFGNQEMLRWGSNTVPAVPMQLFSKDTLPREKWGKGWLYRMSHPCSKEDTAEFYTDSVSPHSLIELFYENEITGHQPFIAIVYPDFTALYERLCVIADKEFRGRVDLRTWTMPPATDKEFWVNKHRIGRNLWHVPFDQLNGVARAVLIDDPPKQFFSNQYVTAYKTRARYMSL